jgi:hypothetical protein
MKTIRYPDIGRKSLTSGKFTSNGVDHLKSRSTFFNKEESTLQEKTQEEQRKPEKVHVSKYQKR